MRTRFKRLRRRTTAPQPMAVAVADPVELELEPEAPSVAHRPKLDTYRSTAPRGRLPQCPECGHFRIHMERERKNFVFGCLDCDALWDWSIGQPWPRTTPRPRTVPPSGEPNPINTSAKEE